MYWTIDQAISGTHNIYDIMWIREYSKISLKYIKWILSKKKKLMISNFLVVNIKKEKIVYKTKIKVPLFYKD